MQKVGLCAAAGLAVALVGACATENKETRTGTNRPAGDKQAATVTAEQNDAIDALFRRKAPALQRCWQEEYERTQNRKVEGDLSLQMVISTGGKANDVKVLTSTINSPPIEKCVVAEVTGWSFPEGPGTAPYRRTVHLGPQF